MKTHDVLTAFGANLGDGAVVFEKVLQRLTQDFGEVHFARLLRTRAVTLSENGGSDYWNSVIRLNVPETWTPRRFLKYLLNLEHELGRQRKKGAHWEARTVDLDLLLWDSLFLDLAPELVLPHPMISWRRFVLEPACEIAPEWVHPLTGRTLEEMLHSLEIPLKNTLEKTEIQTSELPFLLWNSMEPIPQALLTQARLTQRPILARRWVCRNEEPKDIFQKITDLVLSEYGKNSNENPD